jgi:hypothetical protein
MATAQTETTASKKTHAPKKAKKSTAIAKKESAAIEVADAIDFGDDAGMGYDNDTAGDIQVPRVTILQALSPQCQPIKEGGIEGAEAGLFYNTLTKEMSEEIYFVVGKIEKCYQEWVPRKSGGGFVARHELGSPIVKAALEKTPRGLIELDNGNELKETVFMYVIPTDNDGNAIGGFAVLDFTSSKLTAFRGFNTMLRSYVYPIKNAEGKVVKKVVPPLYSHRVKATTVKQVFDQGSAYNYVLSPVGEAGHGNSAMTNSLIGQNHPVFQEAKELARMVNEGFAKITGMEEGEATGPSDAGEEAPF